MAMEWEQRSLISELTQGKELAKQLLRHLHNLSSPSETTSRDFLVEKILSCYEKALLLLGESEANNNRVPSSSTIIHTTLGSPHSYSLANSTSPRSEVTSDQDCRAHVFKKRKTQPRWTEQVKVCSGSTGLEGPRDDGHSWRKYGQKDILGSNFPRGYYRCTHRPSQGCLATKQVQRSDQDPTIFEVTYRGRHTCVQASSLTTTTTSSASPINDGPNKRPRQGKDKPFCLPQQNEEKPNLSNELFFGGGLGVGEGLRVKTEDLDTKDDIFPSFSFTETMMENNLLGCFSPTFLSPTTSESNYFSVSPCPMTNFVQTPESGLSEIVSAPTSVTNSPIWDLDISIDNVDFDPNSFDNLEFFS